MPTRRDDETTREPHSGEIPSQRDISDLGHTSGDTSGDTSGAPAPAASEEIDEQDDGPATQALPAPTQKRLETFPDERPAVRIRVRPAPVPEPERSGPDRRTLAVFGGLAAAGLAIGVGAAFLTGGDDPSVRAASTPAPSTAPTPSLTPSSTPTPTPTPSKTPTPTPTRVIPPDYSVIPADAVDHDEGLDFGYLTAVRKNGELVSLTFDRASIITKKDGGFVVDNTNPAVRTFQVLPKASLVAISRLLPLGAPAQRRPISADELVTNAGAALTNGQGIAVWIRHSENDNGPVTALSEQYLP